MTITTIEQFYTAAAPFATLLDEFAQKHQLRGFARADHFCYKCSTALEFEQLRALLEPESKYLYQAIISGRRIACIKLKQGIATSLGLVTCLELSDQKPDGSQVSGFDHVEIYPRVIGFNVFLAYSRGMGIVLTKDEKPHHTTYNLMLPNGFEIKLTHVSLFEKIRMEMQYA